MSAVAWVDHGAKVVKNLHAKRRRVYIIDIEKYFNHQHVRLVSF